MEPSQESISSRRDKLNGQILGKSIDNRLALINRECLLDALQALFDECSIETLQKYDKQIAQFVERYKSTIGEVKRLRVNITDFDIKDVIGRGHFGEVHVVKEKQTGDIYAMKTIRKCDSFEKTSFDTERDIMAFANSPWITSLQYAFQDSIYLFFVMEYHPGGDLLGLLYRQGGTLPESAATFYLSEIVLALEDLHAMGYVHRDIKPDNILLDRCGHLKLVDFGSAARLNSHGFVDKAIPVGTPDYIAPEVLQSVEGKNSKRSNYGVSCDYWSLGILAYELTVGKPPFTGQSTTTTYARIMNHTNNLKFPPELLLTQAYVSFVRSLLTEEKSRLTQQQVKQHPLFKNVHFDTLRDQVPPYVPKITSVDDTSNFGDVIAKKSGPSAENFKKKTQFSGRNLPFIGFTFTHGFGTNERDYRRTSQVRDGMIKSMKDELEMMRKKLMKSEDFEETKLNLEKKIMEKDQKLESIESVRDKLERDLAASIAECTALKRTLEFERKDRAELERKALELIKGAKIKWEATERNKIEPLRLEIEQQKEKITQLETTNKMLNEQLQHAFKLENKHKESLEAVEQLSRRSMVGLESRLERVVADSKSRIKNLEATLDEAHCQKRNLENEVRRLKDNEKELMRQLEKTNKEYVRLNSAASDAEKLVKKLGQKVTELENEMENGEDLKVKMSRMKKEIECQKKRIEELERTNLLCREENKVVENYKAEIESLKEKRIEGEKRMSEVENKLQEVKIESEKKINELERKLQKEEQKSASLEKQMLDSENLVNESQELKEQRLKMYKMEKELGNVKIDKRILERELKDATNQIKELTKEKDEHKAKIDENRKIHEAALLELSNINENLSLEIMKITQSQKSFEDRLENERLKHEEEKRIISQLKNALKEKDSIVSEFTSKANFFKDELLGVKEQCKKLEGEKYDGIVELGNSKKENGRLIDEVKDLKRQLETSQTNVEALREACVMIESQVVEYEKINASIQAEKSSLSENTEKLIGDLCKAKEEIQESKKLANEEKSLKLLAETKVKRLTEDVECLQNECQSYKDQCLKYKEFSNNLTEELTLCEEKVSDLEVTVKSYERQIGDWVSENNVLKEEVSQYLTQIGGMKEAHYKLKQQLEELKSAKAALSQRVDELIAELHVKSNYYDEREVKHGSIIKQQTKLIDYLQVKIDEHNNKKKTLTDKLFGHSKKENQQPISLAVNYKDLELELQKQKQINKNLQDENHKLLAELKCKVSPPKLTRHKSDIISPKTKLAMEQLGKAPAPSKSDLFKQSSVRRMYHNIPHRFASKLCKILARCDHCGGQITLGRDVNVCTECKICVHTGCVDSVRTTCGLPQAYAQHFKNSLSGLNAGGANASEGCVNQEGWVKVLSKNNTWDKLYACLTDSRLAIYKSSTKDSNSLVQSFEMKLPECKKKVVLEPLPSEIGVNVASSDLPFILKVEMSTDCWPQVSLVLMALSIVDRDKWYKALQNLSDEDSDKYHIESLISIPEHLYVNCVLDISKHIKVLGTDQGLHSYHNDSLLHIDGPTEVHYICIIPESNVVVMIVGHSSVLISCDLNHLINLAQCAPCTKPALTYKDITVKNLTGFHYLHASTFPKHQMFCAATSKQLVIVKYDLDGDDFVPLRIMDTAEPLGCALFTEHSLIVGADKFFEIDVDSFRAEEFIDGSDANLQHAVKSYKMRSFPLAILQVSDDPKEFQLCFSEFSVFVDEYGRCSRAQQVETSHVPVGFHFVKPYLYIIYFSSVEIRKLDDSSSSTTVDLKKMRYLGRNKAGIYVYHDSKVKLLEGRKLMDCDDASSVVSPSICTDEVSESDRFSFTSSIVQSLDGHLSDTDTNGVEENTKRVKFAQTNL